MNKLLKSFGWAVQGIISVWREEINFRLELYAGVVAVIAATILGFTKLDFILLGMVIIAVLGAEIVNTAIEDLCNRINPEHDQIIGKIKDIMAGFVLIVSVGALIIGIMLFSGYF